MSARAELREIFSAAIAAVEASAAVERALERIGPAFPSSGPLLLLAAGKAACAMTEGALRALGDRIADTVALEPAGKTARVRGPSFADVTVPSSTSGAFNAEIALTAAQIEGLRQGQIYLQIHSETAPDGNLWGWLIP